jgi:hypothetical protein
MTPLHGPLVFFIIGIYVSVHPDLSVLPFTTHNTSSIAYVDDLHWYDHASFEMQRQALKQVDVVAATYAYDTPLMYGAEGIGMNLRQHADRGHQGKVAWLPHATTPQFFLAAQDPAASLLANKKVLISG